MTELLSVGKPPDLLYKQGTCKVCGVPLFGRNPKPRDICGYCSADDTPLFAEARE